MIDSKSKQVKNYLAKIDIHKQWESAYRTAENEKFFEQAFDYITRVLNPTKNSTFLDVGCGTCAHSIRLARRGFFVHAVDFSESILKIAEANVKTKGLEAKIKIQPEDLLSFSFEDKTFDYILCWGVLMHIPDLEKAISELTRILKPGGTLVISEGNMYSFQSIILQNLKQFLGMDMSGVKNTPAGMEEWTNSSAGTLLTRQANIRWLIERFKSNQFTVKKRVAGQFTEIYTRVPSRLLKNLIHGFNHFWFRYIKVPQPALGNIIILQKRK